MAFRTERLLGCEFRKIQPKLRMIAKAKDEVNFVRSDFASALRVRPAVARRLKKRPLARETGKVGRNRLKTPRMRQTSRDVEASVFVSWLSAGADGASKSKLKADATSVDGALATATIGLSDVAAIAEIDHVAHIELGEPLKAPDTVVANESPRRPSAAQRRIARGRHGPVLIGVIDVGGFDFSHEDFLDSKKQTRWLRIWDQGGTVRASPAKFNYGSEIRKQHMDAALSASRRGRPGLPAWALEPQSRMSAGAHGTHVASIAAGNRGVCRDAYLAGVLISLPDDEVLDRRRSFYDSTRIAHAVDYLFDLAEQIRKDEKLDILPISINVSLGTNGGGHDASNAISR